MTRAEFAAIIFVALPKQPLSRPAIAFTDVPANHWAAKAIAQAYQTKYLSGYPNSVFKPNELILRVQAIAALASGLNYGVTIDPITTLKKYYSDFGQIPSYATSAIAAATEKRIIVNYPDIKSLQPNQNATRGEIAAFICRVLEIPTVSSKYIAGLELFVITPQFDAADDFREGFARVQKGNQWGYIDKTAKLIIALQFDDAKSFSSGMAAVKIADKWGYIDKKNKIMIPAQFDDAKSFSEDLAAVKIANKWGCIDKIGQTKIKFELDDAAIFSGGLALVKVANKFGYIDKKGNFIIEPQFDEADMFSEGLAPAKKGDKWGYINQFGEFVISPDFDLAKPFSESIALVNVGGEFKEDKEQGKAYFMGGKWGYICKP